MVNTSQIVEWSVNKMAQEKSIIQVIKLTLLMLEQIIYYII